MAAITEAAPVTKADLAAAYDRTSDLGLAVADALTLAGHAPAPEVSPSLVEVADAFTAIEVASGPARKAGDPARPAGPLGPDDGQGHRQGPRRRAADRPARRPGRSGDRAGLRPPARGRQVGRHARRRHGPARAARPRRRRSTPPSWPCSTRSSSCSRLRPRTPTRSCAASGPRSGSRTSTTASAPSSTSAATDVRLYSRDLHDIGGQFPEIVEAARPLGVGRDPRRRDPRAGRTASSCRSSRFRVGSVASRRRRRSRRTCPSSTSPSMPSRSAPPGRERHGRCAAARAAAHPPRAPRRDRPPVGHRWRHGSSAHSLPPQRTRTPSKPPLPHLAPAATRGSWSRTRRAATRPGRRGLGWLKMKKALATIDCVVVGVEVGHGKRHGVLSDYTFAVRDTDDGPAGHDRQGVQRPDRCRDRRDDELVRGAHHRAVWPVSRGGAVDRGRDRLRRHRPLQPAQVGVLAALPAHRQPAPGQVARRDRHGRDGHGVVRGPAARDGTPGHRRLADRPAATGRRGRDGPDGPSDRPGGRAGCPTPPSRRRTRRPPRVPAGSG